MAPRPFETRHVKGHGVHIHSPHACMHIQCFLHASCIKRMRLYAGGPSACWEGTMHHVNNFLFLVFCSVLFPWTTVDVFLCQTRPRGSPCWYRRKWWHSSVCSIFLILLDIPQSTRYSSVRKIFETLLFLLILFISITVKDLHKEWNVFLIGFPHSWSNYFVGIFYCQFSPITDSCIWPLR